MGQCAMSMPSWDCMFSLQFLEGNLGIRYGALTAAADDIEIIIQGESGHGARPHEAIDAIWIASQVITTLQQAIGRTQNPAASDGANHRRN